MMNTQQHWFAGGASMPSAAGAGSGQHSAAEENVPANGGGAAGMEPEAKRQRLGATSGTPGQYAGVVQQQHLMEAQQLDRSAVQGWIAAQGPVNGLQLVARFGGGGAGSMKQQLVALLDAMCADFDICRRGGNAATCSAIELDDPAVQYMAV